jgi:dUTP pyrophosphatase
MNAPTILIERLAHGEGLPPPAYASTGAAGADICAAVAEDREFVLQSGDRALVPTGLVLHIPEGFEVQVRPRSGLALRHGVTVINAPGTIDWDYRGEVLVLLGNLGREPFRVERGMRIAQLVVAPVVRAAFEAGRDGPTARGAGGFGSTGLGQIRP